MVPQAPVLAYQVMDLADQLESEKAGQPPLAVPGLDQPVMDAQQRVRGQGVPEQDAPQRGHEDQQPDAHPERPPISSSPSAAPPRERAPAGMPGTPCAPRSWPGPARRHHRPGSTTGPGTGVNAPGRAAVAGAPAPGRAPVGRRCRRWRHCHRSPGHHRRSRAPQAVPPFAGPPQAVPPLPPPQAVPPLPAVPQPAPPAAAAAPQPGAAPGVPAKGGGDGWP